MTQAAESSTSQATEANVVLPANDVVIIREHELDCDLATAIHRVRADQATRRSRILVIGAVDTEVVPPEPLIESETLPTPKLPMTLAQLGRLREVDALQEVGQRLLPLLGCLDRFSDECCYALEELDEAVGDQSRARLRNQVQVMREIIEWSRSVSADLRIEADAAANGHRLVDTWALCCEAGRQIEASFPGIRIQLGTAGDVGPCRGRAPDLAEAFFLALVLVAHRIGGTGSIHLERCRENGYLVHYIRGYGEPKTVEAPDLVERFRDLIVNQHQGRIRPDLLGQHATGMTIELPLPELELDD